MTLEQRLQLLIQLGNHLRGEDEFLQALMKRTEFNNGWFTLENQQRMLDTIANNFLVEDKLRTWVTQYAIPNTTNHPQVVGLVMSDDVPLAGFHDLLCTFVAGHYAQIKLADQDKFILPYLIKKLTNQDEAATPYFKIVPNLKGFNAIIATGNGQSTRYYERYFNKYPNIIRQQRRSIAVLTGAETRDDLHALGKDIFRYFGRGSRSISKIYVPHDYSFEPLLEALHDYREIVLHSKYKNNFDYAYALMILNKVKFKANGAIILTENQSLESGVANIFYEYYSSEEKLTEEIKSQKEDVEVIVSQQPFSDLPHVAFGEAQELQLADYLGGVDTLAFLINLN